MMTENSTPTAETGGPGVGLAAEERNGRGQMLEEKSKKQTRDGLGIPGLLAEPTGTDGCMIFRHRDHTAYFTSPPSKRTNIFFFFHISIPLVRVSTLSHH